MNFQTIKTSVKDQIGTITLNRPESRNSISMQMRRELSACLGAWRGSAEVGVVIFTGAARK